MSTRRLKELRRRHFPTTRERLDEETEAEEERMWREAEDVPPNRTRGPDAKPFHIIDRAKREGRFLTEDEFQRWEAITDDEWIGAMMAEDDVFFEEVFKEWKERTQLPLTDRIIMKLTLTGTSGMAAAAIWEEKMRPRLAELRERYWNWLEQEGKL